jgi:hypothetical protein
VTAFAAESERHARLACSGAPDGEEPASGFKSGRPLKDVAKALVEDRLRPSGADEPSNREAEGWIAPRCRIDLEALRVRL